MASSLNHPHILTVHDAGEWSGQQYLVTEFVDGGTLSSWAAAETRSWRQCVELLMGVAEGLAAAHDAHILHRDIKPGNILVSRNGYAKLADFGLAKLDGENPSDVTRTVSGVLMGTTAYMSPEQATGGKCDARSDIFSFGIVLYEALSGKRPFDGKSTPEIFQKIVQHQPPALPDSIPVALRTVVEKALEKAPDDRYQSVREMIVDLRRTLRRTEPESVTRSRRWIPAAALVVVIIVVGAAILLRQQTTPTTVERNGGLKIQIAPPPGGRFLEGGATLGGVALSPDGNKLAFIAAFDTIFSLWIQPLDGDPQKIEGANALQRPFWSPDSKSIAYFGKGGLYRVEVAGGQPTRVLETDTSLPMFGSWSEDDTILFSRGGKLFTVPASGAAEAKELPTCCGNPQVLPGGRAFLYWNFNGGVDAGIYAATFADPKGKRLVGAGGIVGYFSGYLLWRNDTALLAQPFDPATLTLSGEARELLKPIASGDLGEPLVTVSTTGRLIYDRDGSDKQLAWRDRDGRVLETVAQTGSYGGFRLLPDGRALVQTGALKDRGAWLIDQSGRPTLLISQVVTTGATPSPDGRSMIYGTPFVGLFRSDLLSGENRRALKTSDEKDFRFPTDWAGDVVLFVVTVNNQGDIWWVRVTPEGDLAPGAVPVPYLNTSAMEIGARFAPGQNQKWLAYQSNESGRNEVYIRAFQKGDKRMVSQGGRLPVWGPNGSKLFYVSLDNKIMVADVKFSATSVDVSSAVEVFPLSANDDGVLVTSPFETIDGERFLVRSSLAPATRPRQFIDNWPELLKQ
jgi:hypothetical protein